MTTTVANLDKTQFVYSGKIQPFKCNKCQTDSKYGFNGFWWCKPHYEEEFWKVEPWKTKA